MSSKIQGLLANIFLLNDERGRVLIFEMKPYVNVSHKWKRNVFVEIQKESIVKSRLNRENKQKRKLHFKTKYYLWYREFEKATCMGKYLPRCPKATLPNSYSLSVAHFHCPLLYGTSSCISNGAAKWGRGQAKLLQEISAFNFFFTLSLFLFILQINHSSASLHSSCFSHLLPTPYLLLRESKAFHWESTKPDISS